MSYFRECPDCGAKLDPGEKCDCKRIPKMRTIAATAKELELPEHFVRSLVKENKIDFVKAGCKTLINLERFIDYLNGGVR